MPVFHNVRSKTTLDSRQELLKKRYFSRKTEPLPRLIAELVKHTIQQSDRILKIYTKNALELEAQLRFISETIRQMALQTASRSALFILKVLV